MLALNPSAKHCHSPEIQASLALPIHSGVGSDGSSFSASFHDNQRGHGGGGHVLTHVSPKSYKLANAYMLAWPYGFPRIMSSYFSSTDEGPPSSYKGQTKSVTKFAFFYRVQRPFDLYEQNETIPRKFNCGGGRYTVTPPPQGSLTVGGREVHGDPPPPPAYGLCGNGWVCEHRWRQIKNMVKFRNVAEGTDVNNWWDNGNQAIAFSRGNKAFLVINNDSYRIKEWFSTGLPAGTYCDVISGNYTGSKCTGTTITVYADGRAYFDISNSSDDPIIAIHVLETLMFWVSCFKNGFNCVMRHISLLPFTLQFKFFIL
ncbi:alpha-amylase-like [Anneissia japonica]|uniref:alpha-amylase-like n=1 Tax=Anneissia japonica TaxID=1529436 RepID=UPI0014259F31|nr:alpha-amylase-like [Anneissia japonica]